MCPTYDHVKALLNKPQEGGMTIVTKLLPDIVTAEIVCD